MLSSTFEIILQGALGGIGNIAHLQNFKGAMSFPEITELLSAADTQ